MKLFKDYLTESKKTYDFKIKIAGDCGKNCSQKIKAALAKYDVLSLSAGKTTPIQEFNPDFPNHKNIGTTIFDLCTQYPATSVQIITLVAEALSMTEGCVRVRNVKEEEEFQINHAHDEVTGEALLNKDYEASDNQSAAGDKKVMSFLKDLSKTSTTGTQYKGVNDQLLADKSPVLTKGK